MPIPAVGTDWLLPLTYLLWIRNGFLTKKITLPQVENSQGCFLAWDRVTLAAVKQCSPNTFLEGAEFFLADLPLCKESFFQTKAPRGCYHSKLDLKPCLFCRSDFQEKLLQNTEGKYRKYQGNTLQIRLQVR